MDYIPEKVRRCILLRKIKNYLSECKLRKTNIGHPANEQYLKGILFMVDGRLLHGGLADRFFGIITSFALSKVHKVPFRLHFTTPYSISTFFQPNKYNWELQEGELSFCNKQTKEIVRLGDDSNWTRNLKIDRNKQIHLYANYVDTDWVTQINENFGTDYSFSGLFTELFKPSVKLQHCLDTHLNVLGKDYISICFRFRNLLGDFYEAHANTLDNKDREQLILSCLHEVKRIIELYPYPTKCMVTSDSLSFLKRVKTLDRVYICEAKRVHVDFSENSNDEAHIQSFIDLFLLALSSHIYNICVPVGEGINGMVTGFPVFASQLYNKPFTRIWL